MAYPAVLGALAVITVYLACLAPTGQWGIVGLAGLLPAAAVASVGLKAGFLCWAGSSILAFLLAPDKFCVLLFAALFGLYPMVKSLAERPGKKPLEYLGKLAFFNGAFTLIYVTMMAAVTASLPKALSGSVWLLYLAGNLVFLAYDYGFSRLIAAYLGHVRRAVQ